MTTPPVPPGEHPAPPGGGHPPPSSGGGYPQPPSEEGGGYGQQPGSGGYSQPPGGGYSQPPGGGYASPPGGGYGGSPSEGGFGGPSSEGGYAPPPSGGYAPPQGGYASEGQGADAGAYGAGGPERYTPWFTRVLAFLIDQLPIYILLGLGVLFMSLFQKVETVCITDDSEYQLGNFCATGNNGPSALGWILALVCYLAALAFAIWNIGVKQGKTGSSIGKGIMHFKVVGEETGQPIGVGMSIVRQIAHVIDSAICYIGYLFPLWDAKRQTIADKLLKTVCLPR